MYFIPYSFNQSTDNMEDDSGAYYIICGIFFLICFLSFYFRDFISGVKENLKKNIRDYLKPIFFKVSGNTLSTVKEGPLQSAWEYLDTYFLTPSEPSSSYDYTDEDDEYEYENENEDEDEDDGEEGGVEQVEQVEEQGEGILKTLAVVTNKIADIYEGEGETDEEEI